MAHSPCCPPEQHEPLGQQLSCFWQHCGASAQLKPPAKPAAPKSIVAAISETIKRFMVTSASRPCQSGLTTLTFSGELNGFPSADPHRPTAPAIVRGWHSNSTARGAADDAPALP